MPLYEHVFIARQDLSNTQAEGLIEHFGTVLADNGGKLVDHEYWGVKTMAYKINKNRKGHYAFLKTDAPAPAVQEMERLMRLHDDVLRVLTVRVEEHEEGPSAVIQAKNSRDERGREVLALMFSTGEPPATIVEARGLAQGHFTLIDLCPDGFSFFPGVDDEHLHPARFRHGKLVDVIFKISFQLVF